MSEYEASVVPELFEFANEQLWPTPRIQGLLADMALFFASANHESARVDAKVRESVHANWELEQRGEPWSPTTVIPVGRRKGKSRLQP